MKPARHLLLASVAAPLALAAALASARADDVPAPAEVQPVTEATEEVVKEVVEQVAPAEAAAETPPPAPAEAAPEVPPVEAAPSEPAPAPAVEAPPAAEAAPVEAAPVAEPAPAVEAPPAAVEAPPAVETAPPSAETTPPPEPVASPVEEAAPTPEPTPAPAVEAPAAESSPAPEPAPAVEPAPTAETPPAAEPAPTVETPPATETAPTAETPPATEPAPTAETPPAAEPAPTEPKPAEASAPTTPEATTDAAKAPSEAPAEPLLPPAAANEPSVTETQLKAQGDEKEAGNLRRLRERLKEEQAALEKLQASEPLPVAPSDSTAAPPAPNETGSADRPRVRRDRDGDGRPDRERRQRAFSAPEDEIIQELGSRTIVRRGEQLMIQQDESTESDRLLYRAEDVDIEQLPRGRSRTIVTREDGTQIITVRDRYGEVISRTRIEPDGREFVLFDSSERFESDEPPEVVRYDEELPQLRVRIPRDEYVVETRKADRRSIRRAIDAPPVEEAERSYAIDEIKMNRRLRDKVRRIDLNTITFDFGSAALSPSQFRALRVVAEAIEGRLNDHPDDVFLIEGHTDAVGTEYANLLLSDRRAEAVAVALSSNFDIPPENLVTQGYGEEFLKIDSAGPERENRRVAIRRITELVRRD